MKAFQRILFSFRAHGEFWCFRAVHFLWMKHAASAVALETSKRDANNRH